MKTNDVNKTKSQDCKAKSEQLNCPITPEHLTFLHQLRDMSRYFGDHPLDELDSADAILTRINDSLDEIATDITNLIAIEVKISEFFWDEKQERRAS